ncbi:hypothetical protein O1611_g2369 [Lasiodiplodia mahajangana]|uniref:Uncharacterized protein n=1 Tax=Lasiodiplodia mahajangana TaxID=1108764 RepID=A0ACC2JUQ4_9PEZI|nr:hypothetical protein O1611_g2369 [Lasiodiplodia mahajangana]
MSLDKINLESPSLILGIICLPFLSHVGIRAYVVGLGTVVLIQLIIFDQGDPDIFVVKRFNLFIPRDGIHITAEGLDPYWLGMAYSLIRARVSGAVASGRMTHVAMDFIASSDVMMDGDTIISDASIMPVNERAPTNSLPLIPAPEAPNVNYASPSPRQLSDAEWGDLKDLLHKLYIQENKTLEKIRTILRKHHGLVLTQKQLTKRFSEWKFKKNVKHVEMEDFLRRADRAPGQTEVSVEGVRITAAKRERWGKRTRLEPRLERSRIPLPGQQSGQSLPDDSGSASFPSDDGLSLMRRLFSALRIVPPNDMTALIPLVASAETMDQRPLTITNEQFMELSHGGRDVSWRAAQSSVYERFSGKRPKSSIFKCLGIDAIFPSQELIFANPLDMELYPFPYHYQSRLDYVPPPKTHDILQKEMQESSEKIQRLQSVGLGETDAAVALIDSLAVACFSLGHYNKAEEQFNHMLPRLLQRHAPSSRYVVSVRRDLAEVILHLGRFEEANKMAQDVHELALAIDTPGGRLTQRSLHVLAQSYGNLRDLPKEEDLLRQLVQIRLSSLGPRHGDTLAAIRSLCDSIIDSERFSESEELLRVALELSQSAEVSDRRKCLISRKLATVLYKKGDYSGSEALYRETLGMSVHLLGDEHPDTLRCRFWLCKVLRARGSLSDSYRLHSKTVQQQIKTRGELRGSTIESMASLRRGIKLELVVGRDVSGAPLSI